MCIQERVAVVGSRCDGEERGLGWSASVVETRGDV